MGDSMDVLKPNKELFHYTQVITSFTTHYYLIPYAAQLQSTKLSRASKHYINPLYPPPFL